MKEDLRGKPDTGRERSRINGMGDCEYTLDYDALGRVTARTDGEGNLVEASENGTDYHYTHDTEGRVLSKRAWGKTLYENHYDAEGYRDSITEKDKVTNFVY